MNFRVKKSLLRKDILENLNFVSELERVNQSKKYVDLINKCERDIETDSDRLLKAKPFSWNSFFIIILQVVAITGTAAYIFHEKGSKITLLTLTTSTAIITVIAAAISTLVAYLRYKNLPIHERRGKRGGFKRFLDTDM